MLVDTKMAKSKTSDEQEKLFKANGLKIWDPTEHTSISDIEECMKEALFEDDIESFQGGLLILLDHYDYKDIVKRTGLSKSTLYRMCQPNSNPTLSNVCKVLAYITQASRVA